MASAHTLIDFNAWRGHAVGERSTELRALSRAQRQSSATVRRRAEMSRIKARLTLQYAATLCRASDEQRSRWPLLAKQAQAQPATPRDDLRAQTRRARLSALTAGSVVARAEPPEPRPK